MIHRILLERELGTKIFTENRIGPHEGVQQFVGAPNADFEELVTQFLFSRLIDAALCDQQCLLSAVRRQHTM